MNLHPYDNVKRHFHHNDVEQAEGLAAVAMVLRLAELPHNGVLYDLSFYSGGIGVLDRLAIALPAEPKLWANVIAAFQARTPEEAGDDPAWAEEFLWLLLGGEESILPRSAAVQFINAERRQFQTQCYLTSRILFGNGSNVNDWEALWGDETQLNYIAYSQG